jgi:hypothetical protein|eukprot:Stramenopile-MAST_4_protein_3434
MAEDDENMDAFLAELEAETSGFLGESAETVETSDVADAPLDVDLDLGEFEGVFDEEEWNEVQVPLAERNPSSSDDLVIISPTAATANEEAVEPPPAPSSTTRESIAPSITNDVGPILSKETRASADGATPSFTAIDILFGAGPFGLMIGRKEDVSTNGVVVLVNGFSSVVSRVKSTDSPGTPMMKTRIGPAERCGAVHVGDMLYSVAEKDGPEKIVFTMKNYPEVLETIKSLKRPLVMRFIPAANSTRAIKEMEQSDAPLVFLDVKPVDTRRRRSQRKNTPPKGGLPQTSSRKSSGAENAGPSIFAKRGQLFAKCLAGKEVDTGCLIDIPALRGLTFYGVPETPVGGRGIAWRVLLELLPSEKHTWKDALASKRDSYQAFCKDLIVEQETLIEGDVTGDDNPLSNSRGSKWSEYWKDEEVREAIQKDVSRTHPGYAFFQQKEVLAAMRRMLFIFAKLNPGIAYIQGMNEVLAPLYYVFMRERPPPPQQNADGDDGDESRGDPYGFQNNDNVEADTFWCFNTVMSEIRDWFIQTLDRSDSGIQGYIRKFQNTLARQDEELASHLDGLSLDPTFYAFRWITTMLSREFDLPDTVRLWDSLFADEDRFSFLIDICCAMVIRARKDLLASDFAPALQLLQRYPPTDLRHLLLEAQAVRDREILFRSGQVSGGNVNNKGNSFKSKFPRWGRKPLQESSNDDYKEDLQAVVRAASNQAAAFSSAVSTGAAGAAKLFRSWSSSFDERMKRVNNEDT